MPAGSLQGPQHVGAEDARVAPATSAPAGAPSSAPVAPKRFLWLLFLAAVAVNVAVVLLTRRHATPGLIDEDEKEYWGLATSVLSGRFDDILMRRTLPFPLLLAGLRWALGGAYLPVQLAVSVLLALTPPLAYAFARRQLGSERGARLAAAGVLLWPLFPRYGATLYSDSIGLLAFLAFLVAFPVRGASAAPVRARWQRWIWAGVLLGFCVHVKPLYLLYTPFAFLFALVDSGPGVRVRVRAAALLTAGCLLVVLPWSAFLSARQHRLLLISGNDGETLAGGLNPGLFALEGSGEYVSPEGRRVWVGPGKWVAPPQTGYLSEQELALPHAEKGELLSRRATAWIRSHPREVAYITGRKLLYMWGIYPLWNGLAQSLFGNLLMFPLLAAALLALRKLPVRRAALALLWTLPLFVSLVACVSWGSWRFRMPGDLGLIVLAAGLLAWWAERRAGVASPRPRPDQPDGADLPPPSPSRGHA